MASRQLTQTAIFAAPASSIFLAGYSFAFSQNTVVHLKEQPPQISVPLFTRIFHFGAIVIIPGVILSTSASVYLWFVSTSALQRRLYLFAALAALAPLPFTGLRMMPGIKRLIDIGEKEGLQERVGETRALLEAWIGQNYVRVMSYVAAGMAGLYAATLW